MNHDPATGDSNGDPNDHSTGDVSDASNDRSADDVRAIVNPERPDTAAELIERSDAEPVEPASPDDIADAARQAVADEADAVAAIGGDGTQRTVAEAVAGSDTALAVVPGGTVNLLARVLGVDTITAAADTINDHTVRRLDLGRCSDGQTTHSFILNSSSGYDAAVIAHTGDRAKRFGRLGFGAVGLWQLAVARPHRCTVTVDGATVFDADALTTLVLNVGQRGSPSFKLTPDAEFDDGKLDVVVIPGRRRSYVRAMVARARNRRPRPGHAVIVQGTSIVVRWAEPVPVQVDGDAVATLDRIEYSVDPGAVRVRVPSDQ